MNIEQLNFVQSWINALRSNEYKPTKSVLHNKLGFCCLGVLCDLDIKSLVSDTSSTPEKESFVKSFDTQWMPDSSAHGPAAMSLMHYRGCIKSLPNSVQERAGLKSHFGSYDRVYLHRRHPDLVKKHYDIINIANYDNLAEINDKTVGRDKNPFPIIADLLERGLKDRNIELFIRP